MKKTWSMGHVFNLFIFLSLKVLTSCITFITINTSVVLHLLQLIQMMLYFYKREGTIMNTKSKEQSIIIKGIEKGNGMEITVDISASRHLVHGSIVSLFERMTKIEQRMLITELIEIESNHDMTGEELISEINDFKSMLDCLSKVIESVEKRKAE